MEEQEPISSPESTPEPTSESEESTGAELSEEEKEFPNITDNPKLFKMQQKMLRKNRPDSPLLKVKLPKRRGNPYLVKGVQPYNIHQETYKQWLKEHPQYDRKNPPSVAEIVRMFLHDAPRRIDNQESKTRLTMLLDRLFMIATQWKSPQAVTAINALLSRGFGNAPSSPENLDAIKKGGLTVVYVQRPELDPEIPVAKTESLPEPKAPEFIEGEIGKNE